MVWALTSRSQPEYVLPSPARSWEALVGLVRTDALVPTVLLTLRRSLTGLGTACCVGLPLGWLMGTWWWLRHLLAPWTQALMAVPPIIMVVLGLVWLGPSDGVVVLTVTLVTLPLMTTATRDAVLHVDPALQEMAQVFGKSRWWTVRRVLLPAVAPPVLSALTVILGQSVRLTVMTELLATSTGLGAEVQRARTNLETADVFAMSALMATLTMALELCVLTPLRRRLARPST